MKKLLARTRVLLSAAPTWLAGAGVVVGALSEEIAEALPTGDLSDTVTQIGVAVLGAIAAATAIVRRVTPVFGAARGLLPVDER
jgi:hypothetical protein